MFNTREGEEKSQNDGESEPGMIKKLVIIINKQEQNIKIFLVQFTRLKGDLNL